MKHFKELELTFNKETTVRFGTYLESEIFKVEMGTTYNPFYVRATCMAVNH